MLRQVHDATPIVYYKRYRMEIDLAPSLPEVALRSSYRWVPWRDSLAELHAEVTYLSFRHELDADIFPCLGELDGCRRLLREIRRRPGFLEAATWVVACEKGCVGAIQGIVDAEGLGSIQNVGVIPGHRRLGLGRALVVRSLAGFREAGVRRAYLEVTADNGPAADMYRALGFQRTRTSFRAVT